jgi:hypothetical protein
MAIRPPAPGATIREPVRHAGPQTPLRVGLPAAVLGYVPGMGFLLWILAVILVIAGIVTLLKGGIIVGIILIIVGLAVGPGGWSVFSRRA